MPNDPLAQFVKTSCALCKFNGSWDDNGYYCLSPDMSTYAYEQLGVSDIKDQDSPVDRALAVLAANSWPCGLYEPIKE